MQSRYIRHSHKPPATGSADLESAKQQVFTALISNVQRVQRHTPDKSSRQSNSVYVGTSGTVVMNNFLAALPISPPHNCLIPANLISQATKHLKSALSLSLSALKTPPPPSRASFLETDIGLVTLALVVELKTSSSSSKPESPDILDTWSSCAKVLQNTIQTAISEDEMNPRAIDDDGCEVLYGRAGLLYALLLLRSEIQGNAVAMTTIQADGQLAPLPVNDLVPCIRSIASDSNIDSLAKSIITRGKLGSEAYAAQLLSGIKGEVPALMWRWHGKRYLGAAHGVAGIIHTLLMCPGHILAQHNVEILNTVEWLVDCQDVFGNWSHKAPDVARSPRSSGGPEVNELVHWCHGATGTLIMLSTVLHRSSIDPNVLPLSDSLRDKIISSLKHGASLVYKHGFLRKGVGLCHGVAGSVFALLAVSSVLDRHNKHIDDDHHGSTSYTSSGSHYLLRAVHLAQLATAHETLTAQREMNTPDHPWSLYEGMAGMCCAWGEVLSRLECSEADLKTRSRKRSNMPGFDDIEIVKGW